MARDSITDANAPQPRGPYSQAVRAAGLVFVAGQLPLDRDGALVGVGDIRAQTAAVLANMRAILEAAGSSMDRVVKTTVFLADRATLAP
jgi:2-iminobutanoate/2-iminopropanoate deaminase